MSDLHNPVPANGRRPAASQATRRRRDYHHPVSTGRIAGPPPGPSEPSGDPVSITTARPPLTDDLGRRQRRYLLQMSVRVVCFVAAVLVWGKVPVVVCIALMVAATVLPYVAVLAANAAGQRRGTLTPTTARLLPAGPPPDQEPR